MEHPPFQPFRLHIQVVSMFSSTSDVVLTHMRERNIHNARSMLEGEWFVDASANMLRRESVSFPKRRSWYAEQVRYSLFLVDEMNTCLFHPDVLRALELASCSNPSSPKNKRKVNLGWWGVPLHRDEESLACTLRIDAEGNIFLLGLKAYTPAFTH